MRLSTNGQYAFTTQTEDRSVCRVLAIHKCKGALALTEDQIKTTNGIITYWICRNYPQEVSRWRRIQAVAQEYGYDPRIRIPDEPGKGSCYQVPRHSRSYRGKPRLHYVMRQSHAWTRAYLDTVREFAPRAAGQVETEMPASMTIIEQRERNYRCTSNQMEVAA